MFETVDVMISIVIVFLILSMILKYLMTVIKIMMKTKAKIIAEEMKTFVGKNTSKYLIPYLTNRAEYLNFLDNIKRWGKKEEMKGLRQLSKVQLYEIVNALKGFLERKSVKNVKGELGFTIPESEIKEKLKEVKEHLGDLKKSIENSYDNTMQKISERYEKSLRLYTLVFGFVLVLILNADFFVIYDSLSKNALDRTRLIGQAEVIGKHVTLISEQLSLREKEGPPGLQTIQSEINKNVTLLRKELKTSGFEIGWRVKELKKLFPKPFSWQYIFLLLKKILGLTISGLLISFGAPFWHDLLGSLTGINKVLKEGFRRNGNSAPKTGRK